MKRVLVVDAFQPECDSQSPVFAPPPPSAQGGTLSLPAPLDVAVSRRTPERQSGGRFASALSQDAA